MDLDALGHLKRLLAAGCLEVSFDEDHFVCHYCGARSTEGFTVGTEKHEPHCSYVAAQAFVESLK